jgi:hypothetical protein
VLVKASIRFNELLVVFFAPRFSHHVAVRISSLEPQHVTLKQRCHAVVIRVGLPYQIPPLVLHFVDHNSDDAVTGVCDQLQHAIVEIRPKRLVFQAIERFPSVHDLGSVKDYFPCVKDLGLECIEGRSKAFLLMLEAHNDAGQA